MLGGNYRSAGSETAIIRLAKLALAVISLAAGTARSEDARCGVELVLAFDMSRSVDTREFRLMRDGTAAAFLSPEIAERIAVIPGGVMVAVSQWSGATQQQQVLPWRRLSGEASIADFASALASMTQEFDFGHTAPGNALLHAEALGRTNPVPCLRRVIDMAGDGLGNNGRVAGPIADRIAAGGVTINGLVVRGADPDPLHYYQTQIRRGAGSFVEIADGFEDFRRAMHRKLLKELTMQVSRSDF